MKKPVIHFESAGRSGNIYFLLGAVRDAMRKQRRITEYNDMWQRVQLAGSYEQAISIIREYVDLVDVSGRL